MTEESFQQCRKLMQKANWLRGRITTAKGNVGKWTKIEDSYRKDLRESQAIGARKMLDRAMAKLKEYREKFAAIKFPDSDIVVQKKKMVQCECCGDPIAEGKTYCGECLHDDY